MNYVNKFGAGNARWGKVLKEEYGVVPLVDKGKVYPPMDVMFDRLRGFSGSLTDLRRNREKLKLALAELDKIYRQSTESACLSVFTEWTKAVPKKLAVRGSDFR